MRWGTGFASYLARAAFAWICWCVHVARRIGRRARQVVVRVWLTRALLQGLAKRPAVCAASWFVLRAQESPQMPWCAELRSCGSPAKYDRAFVVVVVAAAMTQSMEPLAGPARQRPSSHGIPAKTFSSTQLPTQKVDPGPIPEFRADSGWAGFNMAEAHRDKCVGSGMLVPDITFLATHVARNDDTSTLASREYTARRSVVGIKGLRAHSKAPAKQRLLPGAVRRWDLHRRWRHGDAQQGRHFRSSA